MALMMMMTMTMPNEMPKRYNSAISELISDISHQEVKQSFNIAGNSLYLQDNQIEMRLSSKRGDKERN